MKNVVFYLEEQALDTNPGNVAHQNKTGLSFVADNTGESTPFDWYNAARRLSMDLDLGLNARACRVVSAPSD